MGNVRRYGYFPPVEVITAIEGVVVVDLPPPGNISGVGTGVAALVGEFPDMSHAVSVATTGVVSSRYRPVEVFGGQDMLDAVGGWDATLGQFGGDLGNGFAELRNKTFSRLVLQPINLTATSACRLYRQLPTCVSATNPEPAVPLAGGVVPAGYEFTSSGARIRTAARATFDATAAHAQGVDGAVTAAGSTAATQSFTSAGAAFTTDGTAEGDLLVVGVISGAGALGANADTYRVVAVSSATALSVEKLDGSVFDWTTGTALPYRVHAGTAGDTGGVHQLSEVAGCTIPVRPLDSTVAMNTSVSPTVAPPTPTASAWDPLSGLKLHTHITAAVTYVAATHAPNTATTSAIEAEYTAALAAFLEEADPAQEVNIIWCARKGVNIANALRVHTLAASQVSGRMCAISPEIDTTDTYAEAAGAAWPGVGAIRHERAVYAWPGVLTQVPEAVGYNITGADGVVYTTGILDTSWDGWLVSLLSMLPPERNPGQHAEPVKTLLSPVLGIQRGLDTQMNSNVYTAMRAKGIAGPRHDKRAGWVLQSGVTSSLTAGETNINRRRMADFIEDSVAERLQDFAKLPLTNALEGAIEAELVVFLRELESPNNPAAQRIDGWSVDITTGNTPSMRARGIFVAIGRVRLTPTADFIVFQAEIGESVTVSAVA